MSSHQYVYKTIESIRVLPTSSVLDYEVYSPDLSGGVLYLGGWLTTADIGPDQLYQSSPTTDGPTPITWAGPAPYSAYHLNDPSVVTEANGTLAMFMTALPNAYGYSSEMTSRNVTALATSTNNGASWTFQGVVIGQNNGIDGTGAWSPSALVQPGGDISVWYNTGWTDVNTAIIQPIRVLRTQMDPTGTQVLSTSVCLNAMTYTAISAENVDVYRATDGTYWMVGNDYSSADGSPGKIVLYESQDGLFWTPWSTSGATLIVPSGDTVLMTPTITGETGGTLNLMYSEQAGSSATVQESLTITLSDQPAPPTFTQATVFNGIATATVDVAGKAYTGPVDYLQSEFIYAGTNNVNITALVPNAFLHGGSGNDALAGLSGHNVLDGGEGSNFLTGGSGTDTFFLVASGNSDTWSTVNGFKSGDDVTLWDVTPSTIDLGWLASQGAPTALGATLRFQEADGHYAFLTLAGWSVAQAQSLSAGFGTVQGRAELHLQA